MFSCTLHVFPRSPISLSRNLFRSKFLRHKNELLRAGMALTCLFLPRLSDTKMFRQKNCKLLKHRNPLSH